MLTKITGVNDKPMWKFSEMIKKDNMVVVELMKKRIR